MNVTFAATAKKKRTNTIWAKKKLETLYYVIIMTGGIKVWQMIYSED